MQQIALVIDSDLCSSISELNQYLADGWRVVQTCPMPSSVGDKIMQHPPTCMVIIEQHK